MRNPWVYAREWPYPREGGRGRRTRQDPTILDLLNPEEYECQIKNNTNNTNVGKQSAERTPEWDTTICINLSSENAFQMVIETPECVPGMYIWEWAENWSSKRVKNLINQLAERNKMWQTRRHKGLKRARENSVSENECAKHEVVQNAHTEGQKQPISFTVDWAEQWPKKETSVSKRTA